MTYDVSDTILAVVALLPAVVLGVYIFIKDRHEKEPFWLLALLFAAGLLITVPAGEIENLLSLVTNSIFSGFVTGTGESAAFTSTTAYYSYHLVNNIVGIALVEEGLKWAALILITRKSKHFNSLFDGIIYAVFVSLGFAALENVLYVFNYGLETGLLRAITAVPGHVFDAIIMGYCYSFYHVYKKAQAWETEFKKVGFISNAADEMSSYARLYLASSIVFPVIVHGLYDFMLSVNSTFWTIVFFIFLGGQYIYAFFTVRKISKLDNNDNIFAIGMLSNAYPQIRQLMEAMAAQQENTAPAETIQ